MAPLRSYETIRYNKVPQVIFFNKESLFLEKLILEGKGEIDRDRDREIER